MNYTFITDMQRFDLKTVSSADLIQFYSMHPRYAACFFSEGKMTGWLSMQAFLNDCCKILLKSLCKDWIISYTDYIADHSKLINFWQEHPEVNSVAVGNSENIIGQFIKKQTHSFSFETRKKLDALKLLKSYEYELRRFFAYRRIKHIGIVVPNNYESYVPDWITICSLNNTEHFGTVIDCFLAEEFSNSHSELLPVDEILSCALLLELSMHPTIMRHLYFIDEPIVNPDKLYSDELEMLSCVKDLKRAMKNTEYINKTYSDYPQDKAYLERLGTDVYHAVIISNFGTYRYNVRAKLKGEFEKYRITPSNQGHSNHIYCYGPCICYSIFTSVNSTIEEYLQQFLNKQSVPFDVKNCGVPNGVNFLNDLLLMIYSDHAPVSYHLFINRFGNLIRNFLKEINAQYISLTPAFADQHYWFFNENLHMTPKGNFLTARRIMDNVHFLPDFSGEFPAALRRDNPDSKYYFIEHNAEDYLNKLKRISQYKYGTAGFLQISANPLTNSHARLIEQALLDCDTLYISVIEDRNDAFPFYDRYQMVCNYCSKYKNVYVFSGSYFLGSRYTMTSYFNSQYDLEFQPELEIFNFEKFILSTINPDVVFMLSESDSSPSSPQKKLLYAFQKVMLNSEKKIKVVDRVIFNNIPISSNEVRKRLRLGDLSAIEKMVPEFVLQYLQRLSLNEIDEYCG